MEHTKGELKVRVVHQRGWSVQLVSIEERRNVLQDYNLDIAKANAEHIKKCWNEYDKTKQQRDDLLAVCDRAKVYITAHPSKDLTTGLALLIDIQQITANAEKGT